MAPKQHAGAAGSALPGRPPSPFKPLTLVVFGLVFIVLLSSSLRNMLANAVGIVLEPTIGFDGREPALTLFLASLVTGVLTGAIRHFLVDWAKMARVQETMRAFQKELKQARKDENSYKVKKLTALQPELMKLQAEMSGEQFKPMAYTMLIVIPMFAWLWIFVSGMAPDVDQCAKDVMHTMAGCPSLDAPWGTTFLLTPARIVSFFPTWILIYSLFSIPIGQVVQKGLKAWEFDRKLKKGASA